VTREVVIRKNIHNIVILKISPINIIKLEARAAILNKCELVNE
jgi:hypothetical protein